MNSRVVNPSDENILVIGGVRKSHKILKTFGARLSLMIDIDKLKEDDANNYDNLLGVSKDAPSSEWLQLARSLHKNKNFDNIAAFHEHWQLPAALIAKNLGFEYNSPETIESVRDKYKTRKCLRNNGIDNTKSKIIKTKDDLDAFIKQVGFPIILKPLANWGSTGISKINNSDEIDKAFSYIKDSCPNDTVLAEEFLNGEEYSVEGFSFRGHHKLICITQKFKDPINFVENGHCLPADLDVQTQKTILDFTESVLSALKVNYGGTHTEVILTKNGPKLVEAHTRLGGYMSEMIKSISSIDLNELVSKQPLNNTENFTEKLHFHPDKFCALWFASPEKEGVLKQIIGLEEALKVESIVEVRTCLLPNAKIGLQKNSFSRGAYAISVNKDKQEALKAVKKACSMIDFIVE